MLFQVYSQHGQSTRSINGPNNDNDLKSKASQIIDLSFWMVSNRFYINLYIILYTHPNPHILRPAILGQCLS